MLNQFLTAFYRYQHQQFELTAFDNGQHFDQTAQSFASRHDLEAWLMKKASERSLSSYVLLTHEDYQHLLQEVHTVDELADRLRSRAIAVKTTAKNNNLAMGQGAGHGLINNTNNELQDSATKGLRQTLLSSHPVESSAGSITLPDAQTEAVAPQHAANFKKVGSEKSKNTKPGFLARLFS